MNISTIILAAILPLSLASVVQAATPFYVQTYEGNSQLYLLDPDTGGSTLLGFTGVNGMTDLAVKPTGQLFGVSLTDFYAVNPANGAATLVGPLGAASAMVGLDVATDGQFYGVEAGGNFFRVNEGTGAATLLFNTGRHYIGDVTHFAGDIFYATAFSSAGTESDLIEINAGTGTAVNRGQIAADIIPGLDFDVTGRLIALSVSGSSYQIPAFGSSGSGVLLSASGVGMAGATTVPAPEPATGALLLLGAAGLALRRRRLTAG